MRPASIALNYSTENIRNDIRQKIYIWKILIRLTSVGLAHTRPNNLKRHSHEDREVAAKYSGQKFVTTTRCVAMLKL